MIDSMNVYAFSRAAILLTAVLGASGADYYVDATAGEDSNPGKSIGSPWKSLEKVNAAGFAPGDRILFKSGETWVGQLIPKSSGTATRLIIFARYGSGPRPKIDG